MIIVHIKNNQSRSTESIYIQNLMYIILMENYGIDYKLLLPIIQCDSGQVKTTVVKRNPLFKFIFNWEIIAPQCSVGYVCLCVSRSVMSNSLWPYGLQLDFPDKHTGVDCYSLIHWIFPTQGSNPGLLHCRQFLCCLSHQKSP